MSGDLPRALRGVEQRPQDPQAWLALGLALRAAGQPGPGAEAFQQALRRQPGPGAFLGWAACVADQGRPAQAVGILTAAQRRGLLDRPGHHALARFAADAGDLAAATAALDRLVASDPGDGAAWLLRGITAMRAGRGQAARSDLARAVALLPEDPDSHANLAAVCESLNALDDAAAAALAARARAPAPPLATLTLARVRRRQGDPARALALLDALPVAGLVPHHAARRAADRALCLDALGAVDAAWAATVEMNAHARARPGVHPAHAARWSAMLDAILADAAALARSARRPWTPPDDGRSPVFVVGFPRSGTTLLEVMLGAHPALQATDELPVTDLVLRRWETLLPGVGPYPAGLHQLDGAARARGRAAWLAILDEVRPGLDPGRRIIDKVPLSLVHLPLLHALFPRSPLVVLLRDPRDTALSCFQQDFAPGATNDLMMDMDTIVDVQARAFAVLAAVRPVLAGALHVVRYEDLVADHEAVSARLLAAIGLGWDPAVARYREGLAGAHISTPSYAQVVRPVTTAARGKWRRYEGPLAPWRDRLDETAAALGYPVG